MTRNLTGRRYFARCKFLAKAVFSFGRAANPLAAGIEVGLRRCLSRDWNPSRLRHRLNPTLLNPAPYR